MNDRPLVSIIINNYNYSLFLREAIESALQQTYSPVEVIVVDDGSTDNSREIIQLYQDKLTCIFKINGGQASAFNAGFAQSHGEIIVFLDSDDRLLPEAIQHVVDAFHLCKDAAKVQYRMEVIDQVGKQTGVLKPPTHLPMLSGDLRRHMLKFPFDMVWLPTSGNAFAARVLRRIFPIPEEDFRILADYYVSHLTALFGPVVSLSQVCACYRVHGSNHYEQSAAVLNLDHVRRTIIYWKRTQGYLKKFVDELQLSDRPLEAEDIYSVSYIANRLVSLKLDPATHPLQKDTMWGLYRLGVKASFRRFDVSLPMKCLFLLWFTFMSFAPQPFAGWLAEIFFFPERRGQFNRVLRLFHLAS